MRILFYNCEVINKPNVVGWTNYQEMGISVIGCMTNQTQGWQFFVFDPDIIKSPIDVAYNIFQNVVNFSEFIVGFNSKAFDDKLCQAHGIQIKTDFDLLEEIRLSAYGSRSFQKQPKGFSYSLDALAKANLEYSKTGNGALAPELWQAGKHREVID